MSFLFNLPFVFLFELVNAMGCLFKEPKITCVHVVLLGFITIIAFMAVLHMHWLFSDFSCLSNK